MTQRLRQHAARSFACIPVCLLALGSAVGAVAAAESTEHTFLTDLPPEARQALRADPQVEALRDDPGKLLDRVFAAMDPYSFKAGVIVVQTDRRWFATVAADDPAAPLLELRRWPGDSVLALYSLAGAAPQDGQPHRIAGAKLEKQLTSTANSWKWEGVIDSTYGSRPAEWIERRVGETPSRLGALLLPGDAGLGSPARFDLIDELLVVLDRVEIDEEGWRILPGIPASTPLTPPRLDSPYGDANEKIDAWQAVEGVGYSLGLPPGVRARRLDIGIPCPTGQIPGGLLWFRGRYTDLAGQRVAIGDGTRSAYLAEVPSSDREWAAGKKPPVGAPKARLLAREAFHSIEAKPTGATALWAERWREPGFEGQWLVFRIDRKDRGVEIALPMLAGRQSLSVFQIPTTWRGPGEAAAPPPIDPAERFGINFERFSKLEQRRHPGSDGYLRVPGLRVELPRAWWPSAMLRSRNGFPVRIVDGSGQTVGTLALLPTGAPELKPESLRGWETDPRPGIYRAQAVYRRGDSWLYVMADGNGFLLEAVAGAKFDRKAWKQMAESALVVLSRREG